MPTDVERVDVSEHRDALPEELSGFDSLVRTESPRSLYGEDSEGNRTRINDMGGVILHFAAKATGAEVERLAPAGTGRRPERGRGGNDIEARIQRAVEQAVQQALAGTQEREQQLQEEIDRLRQEIERLQKPLHERLDEAFGDTWVPRDEGIAVARRGNDGFTDDGWTTASQPYERGDRWYIRIKKGTDEEEAELASLIRMPETPPADEAAQRQQRREELESRIAGYEGVNLDNLYQTYRGHLQAAANGDERAAFANDATRAAATAQIRSQEVRSYLDSMNEQQRNALPASAVNDLTAWLEARDAQEPSITPAAEEGEQGGQVPDGIPEGSRPVYRRRSRLAMWGDRLRRRPVQEWEATGVYAPPDGGYVREVDGEVVEVMEDDVEGRDGTARALGAAALIGVGALAIWGLVEHKYMGHSPTRELRHNGVFPYGHFKGVPNHHLGGHEVTGGPGLGNGTHTDFFNRAPGHRRTAVEAARTIHLTGNPGDKTLKDGNHVILKHVQWTKEGLLSKWDRMRLRNMGYQVEWGKLQDVAKGIFRYKSIVSK
jgi:hypothetical protein